MPVVATALMAAGEIAGVGLIILLLVRLTQIAFEHIDYQAEAWADSRELEEQEYWAARADAYDAESYQPPSQVWHGS